jgi:hypothetical protein
VGIAETVHKWVHQAKTMRSEVFIAEHADRDVCGELVEHRCQGRLVYMPGRVIYQVGQLIPCLPPASNFSTSTQTEPIGPEHPRR